MLKQKVKYEDFDGNIQDETLYFNLSRMELVALQGRYGKEDMAKYIEKLIEDKNLEKMYELLNDIVLTAYGVRSEDGKRFIKNEQIREEFVQSLAYEALIEDFHDETRKVLENFVTGITSHIRGLNKAENAVSAPA
ncbi:MAG: hypothetical protein E6X42_06200 [Streptococcus parasanguinis]|jgi:hypothetical protein|uniref:Uncharacterized protein n=2 Tax=unclassified Caudoviricetes TaxID=2788787 RepID=A0A8S5PDM4_9CAUD|nr:hypothetical protein [Streptococcus parasanguinis]WNL48680.1 hypothetical protein [Caudovirus D_HF5_2C]DAE05279.1 MAG TPA: hypothetical protein [Siphoviridae sp. ctWKa2]